MISKRKLICAMVSICMILTSVSLTAVAGWDGYSSKNSTTSTTVVSMSNFSAIVNAGAAPDYTVKKSSGYTARWSNHSVNKTIKFTNVRRDWTDYSAIEFWCYSEVANNARIAFIIDCTAESTAGSSYYMDYIDIDWQGWKKISFSLGGMTQGRNAQYSKVEGIRFTCTGWSISQIYDTTALYIDDIVLRSKNASIGGSVQDIYSFDEVEAYEVATENAYSAYARSQNMLCRGKQMALSTESVFSDGNLYCPTDFFDNIEGITVSNSALPLTLSYGEIRLNISADGKYTLNGEEKTGVPAPLNTDSGALLPAAYTATLLGLETAVEGKGIITGEEISTFTESKNLRRIASYLTCFKNVVPASIPDSEYETLKQNWRNLLVGSENTDLSNEAVQKKISNIDKVSVNFRDTMNRTDPSKPLWGEAMLTSGDLTTQYTSINSIALGYATPGTSIYKDPKTLEALIYALDWGYNNIYGKAEIANKGWRDTSLHNWWDWQIGTPIQLVDTLILLEDELGEERIKNYVEVLQHFVPNVKDYGSNRLHFAKEIIGYSALINDGEGILNAIYGSDECLAYVEGDLAQCFHEDGTYIFHTRHFHNGMYGLSQFENVVTLFRILDGTAFEITNPDRDNLINWAHESYAPISYNGSLMPLAMGRGTTSAQNEGYTAFKTYVEMLDIADETEFPTLKELIKRTAYGLGVDSVITRIGIDDIATLQEIIKDDSIPSDSVYERSKVYNEGDRAVHHKPGFSAGVSMSSSRVFNYESINSQNMEGWYMADGMLYVYTDENTQYDSGWISSVNPYRMPGTTVDTQERDIVAIKQGNEYLSSKDFVGGATFNSKYLTAAMDLESYHNEIGGTTTNTGNGAAAPLHHSSLVAKKSWFMFDNEIVALGAEINANDGYNVETIVDNRRSLGSKLISNAAVKAYEIADFEASIIEQAENLPEHTIDGKPYTRWSAQNDVWISYDLGEVKDVGFVAMSFYSGDARVAYFDIEVSEDGNIWQNVFSGQSSGKTSNLEIYPTGNVKARYVKITGHGNSTNKWNSISEVLIYPVTPSGTLEIESDAYVGTDTLLINGTDTSISDNEVKLYENVSHAHLENFGGYYFPDTEGLSIRRTPDSSSFTEMWIDHGISPQGGDYAYVILPGKSAEETALYSSNPGIEILSNTGKLQAVRDKASGICSMVFWEKGSLEGISVDKPLIVMMQNKDGKIKFTASDPTHKLTTATITLSSEIASISGDNIARASGNSITLDLGGSKGKTFAFECEVK